MLGSYTEHCLLSATDDTTQHNGNLRSRISLYRGPSESSSCGPAPLGPQLSEIARDYNSSAASTVHVPADGRPLPRGSARPEQQSKELAKLPEMHTSIMPAKRVSHTSGTEHRHFSDKEEQPSPSTKVTNHTSTPEQCDRSSSASYWDLVQAQMEVPPYPSSLRTLPDKQQDDVPTAVNPAMSSRSNDRITKQQLRTKSTPKNGGAGNKDYSVTSAPNRTSGNSFNLYATSGKRRHQGHSDDSGLRNNGHVDDQGSSLTEESSHAIPPQSKKVRIDPAPETFVKCESSDTPSRESYLDVQLCVPNARGAYEKWRHGKLKSHTVQTLFDKVSDSCRITGHLREIKFTLADASPAHTWAVQEGDEIMFQYVKSRTGRILQEGKYTGIFQIEMEPIMSKDEGDNVVVVLDF